MYLVLKLLALPLSGASSKAVYLPVLWAYHTDRNKCNLIGSMAGRRRMHIIKERKDDEKEVNSKALLLAETSESQRAAAAKP